MARPKKTLRPNVFVRRVIEQLQLEDNPRQRARKYPGATALADILSVDKNTVYRWLRDERGPEYVPTMQMLQMCGWLNMNAEAPSSDGQADPGDARQAVIEEALEALLAGQEKALAGQNQALARWNQLMAMVEEILRRLPPGAEQEPPQDVPEPKTGA